MTTGPDFTEGPSTPTSGASATWPTGRELPLYQCSDWADKPIGRDSSRTPRDRFPRSHAWMIRWTQYAELMVRAAGTGRSQRNQTGADPRTLAELGHPDRLIYRDLDPAIGLTGAELGRKLITECIIPALDEAYEQFSDTARRYSGMERRAVLSWYHWLRHPGRLWKRKLTDELQLPPQSDLKTLSAARWQLGLNAPKEYPAGAEAALETLTSILDRFFAPLKRVGANPEADVDHIRLLLPPALADKWLADENELRIFRDRHLDEPSVADGIRPEGRLEITAQLLDPLLRQILQPAGTTNILIQGPTSSGKSYAGRLVAAAWVKRGRRAIVLLPIKALVTQAVAEWRDFLLGTGLEERWRIVPGSRDYPQYDDDLVRGNYDVAVMIPEKLNALLARGMRLENIGVLVVDELQMVSTESTRGPALEMLLTKLRLETQVSVVGLSALLDADSTDRVSRWLDIGPGAAIRGAVRPVPLIKSVRSLTGEETLETDGSITKTTFEDGDVRALVRPIPGLAGDHARTLALCLELLLATGDDLAGDGEMSGADAPRYRGVLCFVPTRDLAERYAREAGRLMQLDLRFPTVAHDDNPYLGRFGGLPDLVAEQRWAELGRIPRGTLRESVTQALLSGAGYHTARLEPSMRDEMERAFKDGAIRLLFATDTLMLGVNLPADAVVISSLFTPGEVGELRAASRDTIAQRLGRAGRLGLSARGLGVIVLPSEGSVSKDRTYIFDGDDERELATYVPRSASVKTLEERALTALTSQVPVFRHYVTYVQQGLGLRSGVSSVWLSRLLLEHSRRILRARTRDDVESHVSRLYELSLKATEPEAPAIAAPDIVDSLIGDELMREVADGLRVTELGRAVGRTGLPLADANTVRRLAAELGHGAGDLTLLLLAMTTEQVRSSSPWVAIRQTLTLEEEGDQIRGVLRLARYLGHLLGETEQVDFDRSRVDFFLNDDVVGAGPAADELRALLAGQSIEPELDQVTSLLRACVMLLWMRGCPFELIREVVEKTVRSAPSQRGRRDPFPALHASDVRALGENSSYVFDTASDLVGVAPLNPDFRRFERMSESLSIGLPYELSLLARVNLRATHRERLVALVPKVQTEFKSLMQLVVANIRDPARSRETGRTAAREEAYRDRTFEKVEVRTILQLLDDREKNAMAHGRTMHPALRKHRVPGGSDYRFADLLTQIVSEAPDPTQTTATRVRGVRRLFEYCGLQIEEAGPAHLRIHGDAERSEVIEVRVVEDTFTLAMARAKADQGTLFVACGGVSLEVMAAPLIRGARQSVVIEPAVLVEIVTEVMALLAPADLGLQDDSERADSQNVVGDGSNVPEADLADELAEAPDQVDDIESALAFLGDADQVEELPLPPVADFGVGRGYEEAGAAVARLLTVAPPLLTRPDMVRLIDGLRLEGISRGSRL